MFLIAASIVAALFLHEFGHYTAALCFGQELAFRFAWGKLFGKIPVPRFVWDMPEELSAAQKKVVALAGFGLELFAAVLCAICGLWAYSAVALAHLVLYSRYAGEASDFKWL